MAINIRAARRRLITMAVINGLCLLAAVAAIAVYFKAHMDAALIGFAAALIVGFGAQIWFIASLRRANEGA